MGAGEKGEQERDWKSKILSETDRGAIERDRVRARHTANE